jgi:hypothetical protein
VLGYFSGMMANSGSLPQSANGHHLGPVANERLYVLWRGQPICSIGSALSYFETEREAREFLGQCEARNRLVDLAAFATWFRSP